MGGRRRDGQDAGRRRGAVAAVGLVLVTGCTGTTVTAPAPTPAATQVTRTPTPRTLTPSPTPTETRVFLPGGPPVAIRTVEGAGTLQVRRYSWQRTANGTEAAPPTHGYLVLDLAFTATAGRVLVNPLYFTAQSGGTVAEPTLGADGNEPVLASRELTPGETVDGLVAFDLPPGEATVTLVDEVGVKVIDLRIPAPAG